MHGHASDMTRTETGTATDISLKASSDCQAMAGPQTSGGGPFVPFQFPIRSFDAVGQTADQFRKRVKESYPDLVLADDTLGHWRGMEALERLRRIGSTFP
jgi:hypothetical protein